MSRLKETSITRSRDFAPGKAVHYRMSPGNVRCVAAVRDACALANNHVLDFGPVLRDRASARAVHGRLASHRVVCPYGRLRKLLSIFYNPDLPIIDDYGDPRTYDYQTVIDAPLGTQNPSAHSISALTGKDMTVRWGSNFDDDLAGAPEHAVADPNLAGLEERVKMEFEQVFMFYLPRICEHCLNPSCVASCPSGAMNKREEDGIVLVDQDRCRGWRFRQSGLGTPVAFKAAGRATVSSFPRSATTRAARHRWVVWDRISAYGSHVSDMAQYVDRLKEQLLRSAF